MNRCGWCGRVIDACDGYRIPMLAVYCDEKHAGYDLEMSGC